jgi:hypothetical protein
MAADSDENLRIASVELQPSASGCTVDAGSRKTAPVVRFTDHAIEYAPDE